MVAEVGGVEQKHVHLAVSIPPRLAVSDLMRFVKGSASHLLNHGPNQSGGDPFAWQAEYGALSFGKRSLPGVIDYILNQPTRHAAANLWPSFERTVSIEPARDSPP